MTRIATLLSISTLLGCLSLGPAMAQTGAGLAICNRKNEGDYLVAMIVRWPIFLAEHWESSGWYRIPPVSCERWSRGDVNTLYLLSVTQETRTGRRVLDYGVTTIPDWHWNTGSYGMQEFFCVSDEPFERRSRERSAYQRCTSGEYKQLFNVHVFVEHNSSYTLNLN